MKRGGYGKPWRPPADGWFMPNKTYFGGLYQHIRPALNNLPRYQNTTQVPLQPNQVGSPVTRINPAALVANCGITDTSGLPEIPWIGVGANQFRPPVLGGTLQNTFAPNGTNSLGQAARLRGFKNVQALRQWHGVHGWLSEANACQSTYCLTEINDVNGNAPGSPGYVPTYTSTAYEPYRPTPEQVRYRTLSVAASSNYSSVSVSGGEPGPAGFPHTTLVQTASGSRSVDAYSGKLTSSARTTLIKQLVPTGTWFTAQQSSGGAGYTQASITSAPVYFTHGMATDLDGLFNGITCTPSVTVPGETILGAPADLASLVSSWNAQVTGWSSSVPTWASGLLPPISDPFNYSASATITDPSGNNWSITLSWSTSNTVYTWSLNFGITIFGTTGFETQVTNLYSGTLTLSDPTPSSWVHADVQALLGYWNLADDAQYPPRTDGIWQIAPLVSREEALGDVSQIGFNPATVDDLRQPIVDSNGNFAFTTPYTPLPLGWHDGSNNNDGNGNPPGSPSYTSPAQWNPTYNQMAWFDTNAYGFSFPAGFDESNSAANGWGQFALTGLICGMPMPRAFTDPNSFWYNPADPASPAGATFENFFDFRANVWKACTFEVDGGTYVDFYNYGWGQWLYDAIDTTGAQLPHCATQWTNSFQAFNKPPYAYLIQSDQQTYDFEGLQPSPDADFHAFQGDGLWAQKCCEIIELWPSQNFGRPAGNDRFAPDEGAVYCIDHWESNVVFLSSDPANISTGDYVGVSNNGFVGIFPVTVDHGAESLTLGSQVYGLPTGFALPSGDTGTAVWKVRFPNAPAILGRDAIASLTASGGNTIITLASAEVNLMTGDTIDICSAAITYDAKGNRVSEAMTVLQSAIAVNRTDDTHFTVGVAISLLTGAAYIVSHGAANWYWDDNGRKGDFATFQWLYDYRTNSEEGRLAGVTDCGGHMPPTGSPAANTGYQALSALAAVCSPGNSLNWTGDHFQAQGASVFKPCCYGVVAFTPNGEVFNNGIVIPFPAAFTFDDRYGARWQAEIEQAMQDLLWQAPHVPCGLGGGIAWSEDDGTCLINTDTAQYYAHAPFVEARISLPSNGGNGQNETAPALPSGITIGYINPVTTLTSALTPPGMIGYDPASGNPTGAFTFWGYRQDIENNACFGACQFNYVDMENLPCVISYSPPPPTPSPDTTGQGGTNGGST